MKLTLRRTHKVILSPWTSEEGGGGGGLMEPPPRVFHMLQYFEKILASVQFFDILYKMRYILWVVALLEACDVSKDGRHLGRH